MITGSGLDDWIYWRFYYNCSSSQSLITGHNQWLSKTRSIPYWTMSVFSSTVTDLVPIYESVNSSASVVRLLTLHSWTLNHDWLLFYESLTYEWLLVYEWLNDFRINYVSFYTSVRTEYMTLHLTARLLLRLFVGEGTCLPNRCLAMDYSASIPCSVNVC
jgi:hypothetical protein